MAKEQTNFDVVVIGSGPGGYVCAIRAAQLGLNTAIVEKEATLGGTCLNVGCIPSKALLESSEHFHHAQHALGDHGVEVQSPKINVDKMMDRKSGIVTELTQGIAYLMKKNKISTFQGVGQLESATTVKVQHADNSETILQSRHIVLATGSVPNELPFMPFDGKNIVSSTEALKFEEVPPHLVVIGAGAIGLEMGSVWSRLGSEVTVIEYADKICGPMDAGISKKLLASLKKQNMNFILGAKVTGAETKGKKILVHYESLSNGNANELTCHKILVAAGRKPYSDGLNLSAVGLQTDEQGCLPINEHWQTAVPSIFALGDLVQGPMLAHKAEEEGVAVAEHIAGQAGHVNYHTVPSVIYTHPEVASVGWTEENLKEQSVKYKTGQFPFAANGRAKALGSTEGMVKILADAQTDRILGVHIMGPRASELIGEAVVCMEFGGAAEDLARSFHAHPTLSETLREAALNVDNNARQM